MWVTRSPGRLYEKENLALLLALLRRIDSPVVLDIGANVGNHCLAFSTVAAHVHAFEPLPHVHRLLTDNVARNRLEGVVTTHDCALSDVTGDATFCMSLDGNLGASSFDKRSSQVEAITVTRHTGDAYLRGLGVGRVDFVKIDTEAHEVFVLRGLRETLERDLPVITMEWNDPRTLERVRGSPEQEFLQKHYSIHVLSDTHDRIYWEGRPLA